jgi:hypothetical protein
VYDGPFNIDKYVKPRIKDLDSTKSVGIMQREYGIVNMNTTKHIIGTYGADPCVILCMRDRKTRETTLAHIDGGTLDYFQPFSSYEPTDTQVYIVGGNNFTKKQVNQMLIELKGRGFDIHFAHVIDEQANRFAIDCITGVIYLNKHVPVESLPLVFDVQPREVLLMDIVFGVRSPLSKVNIPSHEEID